MKCFNCEKGRLAQKLTTMDAEVRGEKVNVQVDALVCDHCGDVSLDESQSDAYTIASADAYRERHGLLTTVELKAARQHLGMSQLEFAKFLKVGTASVKRWEWGLVQDAAMDELIRLKTDPEAARANLQRIQQPEAPLIASRNVITFSKPATPRPAWCDDEPPQAKLEILSA